MNEAPARRHALAAAGPRRKLEVDGLSLAYSDEGRGPTLLCLHAIGHGAGDYAGVSLALHTRHRVIALDWPGHGHSGDDVQPVSPWRYAQVLERFVEQLALDRVVLVGNSIGGAAALMYTASHLQHVRGLVLANPGGLDRPDAFSRTVCRGMSRFFAAGARGARWYPRAFDWYYRSVLPAPAAAARRAQIVAAAYESAPVLAQAWASFAEARSDVRALIPQIRCPVLFTWATRDRFVALSRSRAAIRRFPNATLEKFESSGHAPFLEEPARFLRVVERFLDGLR